jgi:hypothetical protein
MTDHYRPLIPVDPQGLDDVAAALLNNAPPLVEEGNPSPATRVDNPEHYLILPGRSHGTYSYPDFVVSRHRLSYGPAVEKAARELGITVQNSGTEKDGHQYIGNVDWHTALKLNLQLGNVTLTPRQFIDLKELLEEGMEGKKKVYDGKGKKVDERALTAIYKEIVERRDPWRSEWLDAQFVDNNGSLFIRYNHKNQGNSLVFGTSESLEAHVTENSWIDPASFNRQGLPTRKSRSQKLYFWSLTNGSVARFGADSGGAGLSCDWDPAVRDDALGVRAARKKI